MLGPFCLFLLQLLSLVLQSHLDRDIWGRGQRKEDEGEVSCRALMAPGTLLFSEVPYTSPGACTHSAGIKYPLDGLDLGQETTLPRL